MFRVFEILFMIVLLFFAVFHIFVGNHAMSLASSAMILGILAHIRLDDLNV